MDNIVITKGGINFEIERITDQYGHHRVIARRDDQSAIGQIPGCRTHAYARIEFRFETADWLHAGADSSSWIVDEYEEDDDIKQRSPDACEFVLTDDEISRINEWRIMPPEMPRPETTPKRDEYVRPIFAIGGLNRGDGAEVPMPTPPRGQICRVCGSSEGHGAMFTTIAGGDVCDDCAG